MKNLRKKKELTKILRKNASRSHNTLPSADMKTVIGC